MTVQSEKIDVKVKVDKSLPKDELNLLQKITASAKDGWANDLENLLREQFFAAYKKKFRIGILSKEAYQKEMKDLYKSFLNSKNSDIQQYVKEKWLEYYEKKQNTPLTKEEYQKHIEKSMQQVEIGEVISVEDLIKEIEEKDGIKITE